MFAQSVAPSNWTLDLLEWVRTSWVSTRIAKMLGMEEAPALPGWAAAAIGAGIAVGVVIAFVSVIAMFSIWLERRIAGRIQSRIGPNRVGPFGLLPVARRRREAPPEGRHHSDGRRSPDVHPRAGARDGERARHVRRDPDGGGGGLHRSQSWCSVHRRRLGARDDRRDHGGLGQQQ